MKTSRIIPQNAQSFELLKAAGVTAEELSPSPKALTQRQTTPHAATEQVSPLTAILALSQIAAFEMVAHKRQAEAIVAEYVRTRSFQR